MPLKKEDVLALQNGEVVQYLGKDNFRKDQYLLVDEVDLERGVVTGELTSACGVNNLSIDYLIENGIRIAKWNPSELENKSQETNLSAQSKEMSLEALEKKVDELRSSYSLGLTHKSELSPVNEPVNPYLIELIHRRMKNYNTKFLGNEANLSAQERAEEKGYREQSERDFRGLVRKGLDSVRKSSKIRRFFM